jgi:hypothetical protein
LPEDSRAKLFRNESFAFVRLNEATVAVELELTTIDIFPCKIGRLFYFFSRKVFFFNFIRFLTYLYLNLSKVSPATAAFAAAGGAMNLFMERCRGGRILGVDVLAPWGMSIPKSEASATPVLFPAYQSIGVQETHPLIICHRALWQEFTLSC